MRRLLPYEHALIQTLGITEEEYFDFRKAQHQYKDIKEGTVLDIRNGEPFTTVALVLSILGTIAQVAAALLAPRPEMEDARSQNRPRDRRFAPRYGFDSIQDLAQYGDPLNLVYCDKSANGNGGVRVNTSLLWSAVYSSSNTQYISMMAAVGASDIEEIDYLKTAIGQTLIRLFTGLEDGTSEGSCAWLYFRNNGMPLYSDKKLGNSRDPFAQGVATSQTVFDPLLEPTVRSAGFSQAFSPSSASEFGVVAPIPIKVNVFARDEKGQSNKQPVNIEALNIGSWWPGSYGTRSVLGKGSLISLKIKQVNLKKSDTAQEELSDELRYEAAESLERGSYWRLGSTKFQLVNIEGPESVDKGDIKATFECVEPGMGPYGGYATEDIDEARAEYESLIADLQQQYNDTLYARQTISENTYLKENISEKQKTSLDQLQNLFYRIDDTLEYMTGYKRNLGGLDELVLNAQDVDEATRKKAENINSIEASIEELRDQKKETDSDDVKQKLKEQILGLKAQLKEERPKLAKAVQEYGLSDEAIFDWSQNYNDVIRDLKAAFPDMITIEDSDLPPPRSSGKKGGKEERRYMKDLRRYVNKYQGQLAALDLIDREAFNAACADLDKTLADISQQIAEYQAILADDNNLDNSINMKCIAKTLSATYETLSPAKLIHFAMKAKVFMRISGRAQKYGDTEAKNYKDSDNGNKFRTAMFVMRYKLTSETTWRKIPAIFCVRRKYDRDVFFRLSFRAADAYSADKKWQFDFEPVTDGPSEMKYAGIFPYTYIYLETRGQTQKITLSEGSELYYKGSIYTSSSDIFPPKSKAPYGVDEYSLFSPLGDTAIQFSFDNGPEFRLVAVSEQQFINPADAQWAQLYKNMALIGLNAYSSAGLTNMRNLSVFVNKGKRVRKLTTSSPASLPSSPDGPSNWAPDIFIDTLLDPVHGIGEYVDTANISSFIDLEQLALSKRYCQRQSYFMDGVIADRQSWRAFWTEVAPYSLLEVARIGGKETLIPAVPTNNDGTITRNITVSALFNQGNILEDSYKEDFIDYGESNQDLIATIVYRSQETDQPFPRNNSLTISFTGINENIAQRQTFDLSSWVTNYNQALNYGMLLVAQKRYSRRAIEFKTFPTEAPISPGSYIYVQLEENKWDDLYTGTVLDDGTLNIPFDTTGVNGTFPTLIYKPGSNPYKQTITYSNGQSSVLSALKGTGALFVLGTNAPARRVFRVISVTMEEEGEITISAVEHQCEEVNGMTKSLIVRFDPTLYSIS